MSNLLKGKEEALTPYFQKKRHPCPFYGFSGMFGTMIDQHGNQCALITGSYNPCQMEIQGQEPNWYKCPFNTEENRKKSEELIKNEKGQVFPEEFHPPAAQAWEGISFKQWINYILKTNSILK